MFLGFLMFLRTGGFKVSLTEWLALIEAMEQGLHGQTLNGFFVLCRTLLVKTESDMDKFEELFYKYFKGISIEQLKAELDELAKDKETAKTAFCSYLEQRDMDVQDATKVMVERLAAVEAGEGEEQTRKSEVAGGTMLQGAGGKTIVHARGDRRFRDWRTDCTIESRQFQMAFRLLRELSRKLETSEEELDIRGTIDSTCKRGGILDIQMQPPRRNRLKVMVLIDSGGSMRPYEQLCSLLFQSLNKANTFSDLKIYYFHNCLEGVLYKDPSINPDQVVNTEWILKNIAKDYKVIFVGDAEMSRGEYEDKWFKKIAERYNHTIWLHPQEKEENIAWMSDSFIEIEKIFPMYRLSIEGLKEGMYKLMKGN